MDAPFSYRYVDKFMLGKIWHDFIKNEVILNIVLYFGARTIQLNKSTKISQLNARYLPF